MVESTVLSERDRLLFDTANKNHTHQDTLRWTLAAAFAAFFAATMTASVQPTVADHPNTAATLEYGAWIIGSFYFFVLAVEGWYYNLYLGHLVECERRLSAGQSLRPLVDFPREHVRAVHPSYSAVLLIVGFLNAYHFYQALLMQWTWEGAIAACGVYVISMMLVVARGGVPQWLDQTLGLKHEPESIQR